MTARRRRARSRRSTPRSPRTRATPRKAAARPARRVPVPPPPTRAELVLLALAREIGDARPDGASPDLDPLADVLERLAAAYGPDGPLPRAVSHAWLASRRDKTRALALAWAREQLRLGLQDFVERSAAPRGLGISAETLTWLLLAACESLAHEPPGAVADRIRTLRELAGAPPSRG